MTGVAVQNAVVTLTGSQVVDAARTGAVIQEAWIITGQRATRFSVTPVEDKAYVTFVIHAEQPRAEAFAKTLKARGFTTMMALRP